MTTAASSRATFADIILLINNSNLTTRQKLDQSSAVRSVAKALGAPPETIAAEPAALRRRLDGLSPSSLGVSKGRWANIRSLLGKALALAQPMMPGRSVAPLSPAWQILADQLTANRKIRLLPVLRFLTGRGVTPETLSMADLLEYRRAIFEDRLRAKPGAGWDGLIWAWNATSSENPTWPQIKIERPSRRETYILPWSAFSSAYKADCDRYLHRGSAINLDDEGPSKPMRPSTIESWKYRLRAAASILVARGVPADTISSIADIASVERIRLILDFLLDRHERKSTNGIAQFATFLKALAVHSLKLPDPEIAAIKSLVAKLAIKNRGMNVKNRTRLRPLEDPETVTRFLRIPETMRREIDADKRAPKVKAVQAQIAVAIGILQVAPIRIDNLANLAFGRHLIERGKKLYLAIEESEVKNSELIDFELPPETVDLIAWYVRKYRPYLLKTPNDFLFPGEDGAKKTGTLGTQIKKAVHCYSGLVMHPHLFRHAAAKIFLDARPGEYEVMRQVLRHKSINTTTNFYSGAEAQSASRHFVNVVFERYLSQAASPGKRRSRK